MNKSLQLSLNVIFALAIVYLVYQQSTAKEIVLPEPQNDEVDVLNEAMEGIEIRYINTDTIWARYEYISDLRSDLEQKQEEYRNDLQNRVLAFEKEVIDFQARAAQMSRFEGSQKQKELVTKEQELAKLEEELTVKLMDLEDQMKREIRNTLLSELKGFKAEGIDLIMDNSTNSSLLLAQDSLDITARVLKSLNEKYQNNKEK